MRAGSHETPFWCPQRISGINGTLAPAASPSGSLYPRPRSPHRRRQWPTDWLSFRGALSSSLEPSSVPSWVLSERVPPVCRLRWQEGGEFALGLTHGCEPPPSAHALPPVLGEWYNRLLNGKDAPNQALASGKRWVIRQVDDRQVAALAGALRVSPATAAVLVSRGVTARDAESFLKPSLPHLHSPSLLPDIQPAVERLREALSRQERILVHGDYDVDGVTATALLVRALRALGGNVCHHIPHRVTDGYDLRPEGAQRAAGDGVDLIVTVDCGAVACEAIAEAQRLGVDVIVTDHHHPGPQLPPAVAVVNPARPDSQYPFAGLAGVAVAFKLVCALSEQMGIQTDNVARAFLDLVALGTCADVCPLIDENRVLVRLGLELIPSSKKPGIQALLQQSGVRRDGPLRAWDVAFILGPRLNAAGRVDDANAALNLLLTNDPTEAAQLARALEERNSRRRAEQDRILREAKGMVDRALRSDAKVLVLAGRGWHTGVIGIVAGRLAELYGRPTAVISLDTDTARGSARSRGSFHLMEALNKCQDLLVRYGGHRLAAGFDVEMEKIPALVERLEQIGAEMLTDGDLDDGLLVDAVVSPQELVPQLWREVEAMEPYGEGNPPPVFASRLMVMGAKPFGRQSEHLRLTLRGEGLPGVLEAVAWRRGAAAQHLNVGDELEFAYNLDVNRYAGRETLRLSIADARTPLGTSVAEPRAPYDPFEQDGR